MIQGGGSIEDEMKRLRMPRKIVERMEQFRPVDIYPDNARPVRLFMDLLTQWRMGPSGPTGLDYAALPTVMRLRGVPQTERSGLFDDIRIMEHAALEAMHEETQ